MARNNRGLQWESLFLGLLSRLADCIFFCGWHVHQQVPVQANQKKKAVLGLLSDMDRVGGASTPWSPWPGVFRRHKQPEASSDLDVRDMNGVG